MIKLPPPLPTVSPLIRATWLSQKRKPILPGKWVICNFPIWTPSLQDCLWQLKESSITFIWRPLFPLQQEAKTTSKHTSPSEATDLGLRWGLGHVTWKRNPNVDINCCLKCFLFCSSQTSQFFEESHDVIHWAEYKYWKSNSAPTSFGHGVKDYWVCHFVFELFVGVSVLLFWFSQEAWKPFSSCLKMRGRKTWRISHRLE